MIRACFFAVALAALLPGSAAISSVSSPRQSPAAARPQPTPPVTESGQTERIATRRVVLPISVLDKKSQPVKGLRKEDFLITEDKQPQTIETFADETQGLPIYIGVLLDTSPSVAGKLKFEQDSAKDFIYTVTRLRKDQVAFVTFDDQITLRQDFTYNLDLLSRAVDAIKKPGNRTAFYDAIWQFCDEKLRNAPGRHVLVAITDGEDTYSRATLKEAIDIAQRTETVVYAISTKAGFSGTVPGVEAGQTASATDRDLMKLCNETGGVAFFTGDMLKLEKSFGTIANEMRAQYVVTYRPTNTNYDGSFRRIEVKLASNPDHWKIRARQGYTASRDVVEGPR